MLRYYKVQMKNNFLTLANHKKNWPASKGRNGGQ